MVTSSRNSPREKSVSSSVTARTVSAADRPAAAASASASRSSKYSSFSLLAWVTPSV
jgi:hypothetical protein